MTTPDDLSPLDYLVSLVDRKRVAAITKVHNAALDANPVASTPADHILFHFNGILSALVQAGEIGGTFDDITAAALTEAIERAQAAKKLKEANMPRLELSEAPYDPEAAAEGTLNAFKNLLGDIISKEGTDGESQEQPG